jgi:hypothetical protein
MAATAGRAAPEGYQVRLAEIEGGYDVYRDPLYQKYRSAIDFAINKYAANGSAIYKGSSRYHSDDKLFMRDPMSFPEPRRSKNTMNYYTEWVDNSPQWEKFPKRSRSLICSTNVTTARTYGNVAAVVPIIDTKVGVCPQNDWWNSFRTTSYDHNPDEINRFVHEVLKDNGVFLNGRTVTYDEFAPHLRSADVEKHDASVFTEDLKDIAIELGGLVGLMDHVFDPAANGFKLTTWRQFGVTRDHEIWLSAPCVMIKLDIWDQLVNS